MHRRNIRWALSAGALALTLGLPTAAQAAASAPGVTTGGAANVAQQTARLTGAVDPNADTTTFQFQYGTTSAYGSVTPEQTAAGDGKRTVTADISGLAPATTYHYRLIARNMCYNSNRWSDQRRAPALHPEPRRVHRLALRRPLECRQASSSSSIGVRSRRARMGTTGGGSCRRKKPRQGSTSSALIRYLSSLGPRC